MNLILSSKLNWFILPHVLVLHVLVTNFHSNASKLKDTSNSGSRLSMFCHFFARIDRLQSKIQSPLPSKVTFLHSPFSIDSPLFALLSEPKQACSVASVITIVNDSSLVELELSSPINLKGKLFVLECATESRIGFTQCARLLGQISEHNLLDRFVARRMFVMFLVYDTSSANTIARQLRQMLSGPFENALSKLHAVIVTFRIESRKNQFHFDRITYVRPLKNACFIEPKRKFLESRQFNLTMLMRLMLARDHNDQLIRCNFEKRKITAVVTKV